MSNQLIAVIVATAAVILFTAQSMGLFGGGSPTVISPSSFPLIVLTLVGVPPALVPFLWGAVFVAWRRALLRGEGAVPARTVALWLATTLLSAIYYLMRVRVGVMFEGPLFVVVSLVLNLTLFAACSVWLRRARNAPSFDLSLRLHATLFVWISTYAFPYFGSGVIGWP